ncbi:MAG: BlaI/MecI/CopY family transcriptional regulator [Phycisphaerales bacterium]|nr:MAG: BlaI/MecI/CopY family transcriptional regulator [Phycisphaerales bacterium]
MKLTKAEWQIMNVLWEHHPATARQVAGRLPVGVKWAYTTIKTMLSRLAEKKAVRESKKGNTSVYEPAVSRQKAQRSAVKDLVNQAFDGAFGPLMHFVVEDQRLTAKQRRELMRALEVKGGREGPRR